MRATGCVRPDHSEPLTLDTVCLAGYVVSRSPMGRDAQNALSMLNGTRRVRIVARRSDSGAEQRGSE
jgi:hypothetical protein